MSDELDATPAGAAGRDVAAQHLREEIASGQLPPGFRLLPAELNERYGVTRHSVRLALGVLELEGLVERIPNRGARVRRVSAAEAIEIMECERVLDGLLSAKAAERGTEQQVADIVDNLRRMEEAVGAGELPLYSELIQVHHGLVRAASAHATAADLVQRLMGQIVRHQFQLSLRMRRAEESLVELRRTVRAIESRNADEAEIAARDHLAGVIRALRDESAPTA
ncbi:GntR family transcriptional regulator [Nocardioides sp. DS6]|uniref:GntR family transcriptional regulator n=1 Tax=Nocardioides eburneus TaxID=3231482 RepID=A0ABV3SYJ7_9ACTN